MRGYAIIPRIKSCRCSATLLAMVAFVFGVGSRLNAASDSLMMPDRSLGRLADSSVGVCAALTKYHIRTVQYENMADVLRRATIWMPLRNGGFGQYDHVSMLGAYPGQTGVSLDGRPMTDLWSGQFHLAQSPVGSLDRIEFLYGTDAIGLSTQASSSLINMQSVVYNSASPYMSMWYHQGAGDLVAANVVFAQNVARGLNVSVNVRRAGARGRYQRTDFDQWNVDLQTRWTIDTRQSLHVRYGLATVNTQVWGGVDTSVAISAFEQTTAVSFRDERTLQDESRRHDLTATYHRYLSDDSTTLLSVQAYMSGQSMHRNLGSTLSALTGDTSGVSTIGGVHSGLVVRVDETLGDLHLRAGSNLAMRALDSSSLTVPATLFQPEVFAHAVYDVTSTMQLRSALRGHIVSDRFALSYGLGLRLLNGSTVMKADYSMFQQAPSALQEKYLVSPERHTLAVIEAATMFGSLSTTIMGFYRQIRDPIELSTIGPGAGRLYTNIASRTVMGLMARADVLVGGIDIAPRVRYQNTSADGAATPASITMLDCTFSYEYRTVSNSVRFGINAAWMPASMLPAYEPLYWTFRQGAGQASAQFDGMSAFMTALVGNASLRLSYENILGNKWLTMLNAPELTRVFRLSVDWSFAD